MTGFRKERPLGTTTPIAFVYEVPGLNITPPTGRRAFDIYPTVPKGIVLEVSPLYRYRWAIIITVVLFLLECVAFFGLSKTGTPPSDQYPKNMTYFVGIPFVLWLMFLTVLLLLTHYRVTSRG